VWVEAGNATNPKVKTNKTRNNCTSKQLANIENYVNRIEQLQSKITGLEETQKTLRAQIQWFKDNGRTFDEAAYTRKISQNQSEIIAAQNSISANVKSFNSVDSICRQNDYELPAELDVN
jgi:predicted RNase H-like nuclease (RuvC/YqgF family)